MALEKILLKLREQVRDIVPHLENMDSEAVQPSVSDCEELSKRLLALQEQLAVYKYHKNQKELSPSFSLHAKVSEAVPPPAEPPPSTESTAVLKEAPEHEAPPPSRQPKPLSIGVNDKFRFINELFMQNASEYHIAVEQLSGLRTWSEAELYLASLRNLYGWKENSEPVKYFFSAVKKRYA